MIEKGVTDERFSVTAAAGLVIQRGDGSRLELAAGGYQHFDASPGAGS